MLTYSVRNLPAHSLVQTAADGSETTFNVQWDCSRVSCDCLATNDSQQASRLAHKQGLQHEERRTSSMFTRQQWHRLPIVCRNNKYRKIQLLQQALDQA